MVEGIRKWLAVVMVGLMAVPAGMAAGESTSTGRAPDQVTINKVQENIYDVSVSNNLNLRLDLHRHHSPAAEYHPSVEFLQYNSADWVGWNTASGMNEPEWDILRNLDTMGSDVKSQSVRQGDGIDFSLDAFEVVGGNGATQVPIAGTNSNVNMHADFDSLNTIHIWSYPFMWNFSSGGNYWHASFGIVAGGTRDAGDTAYWKEVGQSKSDSKDGVNPPNQQFTADNGIIVVADTVKKEAMAVVVTDPSLQFGLSDAAVYPYLFVQILSNSANTTIDYYLQFYTYNANPYEERPPLPEPKTTANRLTLTTDRNVYEPGDNVTLNSNVKCVQWSWNQAASGPAPREGSPAVWDDRNHQMLVFGGRTGLNQYSNELWSYNPQGDSWSKKASGATPRFDAEAVWDGLDGLMLIFAGFDGTMRSDLWAYYPSNNTWVQKSNGPPRAFGHSAVWDNLNNQMIVFGGSGPSGVSKETWAYRPATDIWTRLADGPVGLTSHAATWDTTGYQMLIFCGDSASGDMNDTWSYSPTTNSWKQLASLPALGRHGLTAIWDIGDGKAILFGGNPNSVSFYETWAFSPSDDSWSRMGDGKANPSYHTAAWDDRDMQMIVFGGNAGSNNYWNDTWVYRAMTVPSSKIGAEWAHEGLRMSPGPIGAWDDWTLGWFSIVRIGNEYKMWYAGEKKGVNGYDIGYANSSDGISWTRIPTPVLSRSGGNNWDGLDVQGPSVLYNGSGYRMYYSGGGTGGQGGIGLAFSTDGITWTRYQNNPVLVKGSGWDGTYTVAPSVIYTGGSYLMSYTGFDGSQYSVGLASSIDGILWTRNVNNPVLKGTPGKWDSASISYSGLIQIEDEFLLFYEGCDIGPSMNPSNIGLARSKDGINWVKDPNPIIVHQGTNWEEQRVTCPFPLLEDNGLRLWYGGQNAAGQISIGSAFSSILRYNISFQVDDISSQPYFLMTNKTNSAGNTSVSFTLPLNAPEGTYNCSASANVSGTVLLAATSFEVVWPWSPVLTIIPGFIMTKTYHPGDIIGLDAYTGYEYSPASANKSAQGINLTADVYYPNGTFLMNFTNTTAGTGWANLSFTLGKIDVNGTYFIRVTGHKGMNRTTQFIAAPIPPPPPPIPVIRFKMIKSPSTVNRGAAFTINTVIENTMESNINCFLVVQILDSKNVPIRPTIIPLNVTVTSDFIYNVTLTIDMKSPTGLYNFQVQLLTGLPKDKGYALDFRNGTILVN